jgi:(p)ppGpp synthase/HD superfamily hydrolase
MGETMNIEAAFEIALEAHRGQVDKNRDPYIMHAMRVALRGRSLDETVVGALHDVVEDTSITLDDLRARGATDRQLDAIEALTRKTGEKYEAFIIRLSGDFLAVNVKINDLLDNLSPERETPETLALRPRYRWALQYLKELLMNGTIVKR